MPDLRIPWAPRVILTNRVFRLPVQAPDENITLDAGGFRQIGSRWAPTDSALYHYLRTPQQSGDYTIAAHHNGRTAQITLQVRTLDELRRPHTCNGSQWPRRWPVGQPYRSVKTRQTLQDAPEPASVNEDLIAWWSDQSDHVVWRQLPPAELPKAHYTNVHQGCPKCGTSIFKFGGFYPWTRSHLPADFRSECPSCGSIFPSNNLMAEDFTSGDYADDGFGYFDAEGHVFLFAASYTRDLIQNYGGAIGALTAHLRAGGLDEHIARRLGLMLLRYAAEVCYVASAPQFRHGPSKQVEEPWAWGQPDWAGEKDPIHALSAKGLLRYAIDIPYIGEICALAYDTIWPFIREDRDLVKRAQGFGLNVQTPEEVALLIEEMLAAHLQCILDWGGRSNLPRESIGALVLLRGLDRPDAQRVMDWLYDEGPDTLRVFTTNDFFPDGTPPEATGNYNSIHTNGLFTIEYHLQQLRGQHPDAYPESAYPSLVNDPRAPRIARQPHEITMIGKSWFQFGDGSAPGSGAHGKGSTPLETDCIYVYKSAHILDWAGEFTKDPIVREIHTAVQTGRHRAIGPTVHDGVGIAILRTPGAPERAAAGIIYGDTPGHRHRDLLDVQLFAFGRPFLTDLGYPQSWTSRPVWEGHWATHNTVWGTLPDLADPGVAGRGKLLRTLFTDGLQVLDIEADRWAWDDAHKRWYKPGVTFRRLIALMETDGEGIVLIDLSRIRGGTEHWRACRGLQGAFRSDSAGLISRPGTIADPGGERDNLDNLPHPDYTALAYMDDVASAEAPPAWKGYWQSEDEPAVCLDLHQLRASPNTELLTARATAVMGQPDISKYQYHTLLWRRTPLHGEETTCVDLIFEPRVGDPTLAEATSVAVQAGATTAAGLHLTTHQGKRITLYWAPDANPDVPTHFEDGARLRGSLAAVVDGTAAAAGASGLHHQGKTRHFKNARQRGRILALDRRSCTIDVEGLVRIEPGDRICINPEGRAHTYKVEAVAPSGPGMVHLKLDVTSILGRGQTVSVAGDRIDLNHPILARTGNLHKTRLQSEADGAWAEIVEAANPRSWPQPPGESRTTLRIDENRGARIKRLEEGAWVQVVDYVVGDTVLFEKAYRS